VAQGPQDLPHAIGFAVAGGRSLRMGRDKALLPWGSTTLLDHALSRLAQVCGEVRILSGAETRYADRGVPVDVDGVPDAGPLAGLLAGLQRLDAEPGLLLAVDMPFASVPLLRGLLERAEGFDAVVPVTADGAHPLCAVYRRSCLEAVRSRLASGERRMTCFWPDVRVLEVRETELGAFGDPARLLQNVNTEDDYASARRLQGNPNAG
jgi:molybdopterin-guanine dinucleotide biosynthesis protein A